MVVDLDNIYAKKAKYLGGYKFQITFNTDETKIVDVRKIIDIDHRYEFLNNLEIVSKMRKVGPTIGYKNYDIAPEYLYMAAKM